MTASPSPGRPPVQLHRIIDAAVSLVDEQGVDALSMRGLANRMGSGTATLYRHFSGRAELVAHVIDAIMGEAGDREPLNRELPWPQVLEISARSMFDVLCRHPHVAMLMVDNIPAGPNALIMRERALTTLLNTGFSPELAVRIWATLARYVLGFATQLTPERPHQPAAWTSVDSTNFPSTLLVAEHVPIPLVEEFAFGLKMLISGFEDEASSR